MCHSWKRVASFTRSFHSAASQHATPGATTGLVALGSACVIGADQWMLRGRIELLRQDIKDVKEQVQDSKEALKDDMKDIVDQVEASTQDTLQSLQRQVLELLKKN